VTTAPTTPTSRALEAVLLQVQDLAGAPLRVRLQWIEDAAAAVDASVAAGDLGDDGKSAALHLRAALGAIVKWSQGDKKPDSLVELDAIVRTLLARAQLGLLRGLAAFYDDLVDERAPHRAACVEAREALLEIARAVEKGTPTPPSALRRLERVREALKT
jgi:hypothetical protein